LLLLLVAHISLPLIALLVVSLIEFDWAVPVVQQVARLGTHMCILAIGATGAAFTSSKLQKDVGVEWAGILCILAVLFAVAFAAVVTIVRRGPVGEGYKAGISVFLGLLAVGLVCGILIWG
jgi:hypothetical protein